MRAKAPVQLDAWSITWTPSVGFSNVHTNTVSIQNSVSDSLLYR